MWWVCSTDLILMPLFPGSAEMREGWRRLREFGFAPPVSKTQNSGKRRTLILRRTTGSLLWWSGMGPD